MSKWFTVSKCLSEGKRASILTFISRRSCVKQLLLSLPEQMFLHKTSHWQGRSFPFHKDLTVVLCFPVHLTIFTVYLFSFFFKFSSRLMIPNPIDIEHEVTVMSISLGSWDTFSWDFWREIIWYVTNLVTVKNVPYFKLSILFERTSTRPRMS